eukprot:gene35405-42914_t
MKKRILEANDKDAKDMETLREAYARVLAENDNLAQAGARAQKDVDGLMRANAKIQVELDTLKAASARSHKDEESRFRGLAEVLKGVCKVLESGGKGAAEGEVEGLARKVGEVLDGAAAGGGGGGEKAKVAKHLTRLLHVAANTARGKGYYEGALQELKERWGGLGGEVGVADGVVGALLEVMQGEGVFDQATADGGEEEAFVYVPIKSVLDCAAFKEKRREHVYLLLLRGVDKLLHVRQNVGELNKRHSLEVRRKDEDIQSLHTQLDSHTQTYTQLRTQLQTLSQTCSQDQELQIQMHRDMSRLYEAFAHSLVCIAYMSVYIQHMRERSGMIEECVGVYKYLYRQHEHMHRQLVHMTEGAAPSATPSRPSLKSVAIAVLAFNRLLAQGKRRKEVRQKDEAVVAQLKQGIRISSPSPSTDAIDSVLSMYALPAWEEMGNRDDYNAYAQGEVLAQYFPHVLRSINSDENDGIHSNPLAHTTSKSSSLLAYISTKTHTQRSQASAQTRSKKSSEVMHHVHHLLLSARDQMLAHEQAMAKMKANQVSLEDEVRTLRAQLTLCKEENAQISQMLEEQQPAMRSSQTHAQLAPFQNSRTPTGAAENSADSMLDSSRVADKSFEDLLLSRSLYRQTHKHTNLYTVPTPSTPLPAPAPYPNPSPSPAVPSPSPSPSSSFTRKAYIEMLERQRREKNEDIRQTARHISEGLRASSDGLKQEHGHSSFDQSYSYTPVRGKSTQHVFDTSFMSTPAHYAHASPSQSKDALDSSYTSTSHTTETTSSRFLRIHNAEKSLHAVKDTELLEIYADIGRLTGRLETRLMHSHPGSGYGGTSLTSVNNSFNSSLYDTPDRARSRSNSWKK